MIKVLKACNSKVELVPCDAGSEWWQKNGGNSYISPEVWKLLKESDACFKGPTTTVPVPNAPRSVAVSIRQKFELYCNIRPIKTYKHAEKQLDFVCVREATEGLYAGIEFKTSDDSAIAIRKTTRKGCERVAKRGFQVAKYRGFDKVYAITKRNILKETDGIFWAAVENAQKQFTNIVSECASGHVGSIGNVYSGNYGDSYAMFEPAHGSAPKYAGQNKVNPVATILSGAWMVENLGEKAISDAIFKVTEDVINENRYVTYDLGGSATLSQMADQIAARAGKLLKK